MRLQILIDSMTAGGAEMLLADFAAAAPEQGIEVSVAYMAEEDGSPAARRLRDLGIEPVHVPITGLLSPRSLRAVRAAIARERPDVLHTHLAYSDALGGVAARTLGVPAVSTIHVMEWGGDRRTRARERLVALARRRCAARVVAVSEAARRALLDTGWERPEHVVTINNGIALEPRPGAGPAVREELGLAPDELVLAMMGVLRPGKGHEQAFRAVAALRERFPALRLVVLGDGPSRPAIEVAAAAFGEAVVFAGHRRDVMPVLDAVDVLLQPSRVDAFPTALLEAMAARVPVVATRVGGIPEIVVPGETGALVDAPATPEALVEALGPLLADERLRRRMGERGRDRFEQRFTAAHWVRALRALYDEVLTGSP